MPCHFGFKRILSSVGAVGIGVSSVFLFNNYKNDNTVFASWTTNYTPSKKWEWDWDKREPSSLKKPNKHTSVVDVNNNEQESLDNVKASTATRHLIFIRHGQYHLEGVTDEDKYLTELGRQQAALTGERLRALNVPFSRVVYSTMTRATETAQIILEKLGPIQRVEKCDLLREGAPIPPEPPVGGWKPQLYKFYEEGARIEAAFRKYLHRAPASQLEHSYEVFVCHSNVIRYFVCRALQVPPEAWLRLSLYNSSITYITIRPDGRVGLKQLGECGFMPADKLTFN